MNLLKNITAIALVCAGTALCAQNTTLANVTGHEDGVAMLTRELKLDATQQKAVEAAFASCDKDCSAIGAKDAGDPTGAKHARFDKALAEVDKALNEDQRKKLAALKSDGKLAGICGDGKACCAGKAKGGACCAGHGATGAAAPTH